MLPQNLQRPWGAILLLVGALLAPAVPAAAKPAPDSFSDLVKRVVPAVVNISTTQRIDPSEAPSMPDLPPGSPFEEFFRDFFDRQQDERAPRQATSLGSGFVVDPDGIIVTNNHVIRDADEILVRFHDDRALTAEVIGLDEKTDLAVLKVDSPAPLTHIEFGDSRDAEVGDWVIAIGNPFGLGGSVTAGIISARQRDIQAGPYDDFLQTDAAINRGNSGGPMMNMDGEVIGINTAIFSPSGGSVGIGFAVPSNLARPVIEQLIEFGETRRGWIGVRVQRVTDEIAESLGLDGARGALVAGVTPGGPAEEAGIKPGDVLLTFDGQPIQRMRSLPRIVAETSIGKNVEITVWRDSQEKTLRVMLGQLEQAEAETLESLDEEATPAPTVEEAEIASLGLLVSAITDDAIAEFGLAEDVHGVVVTGVIPGTDAEEKGLQPGDVIVEASQDAVSTPIDVQNKIDEARLRGRRSILLLVDRAGDLRFVALTLQEE